MERLIRKDKNGRERFTDISVVKLADGTADIVKSTGVMGTENVSTSRTNVQNVGNEKALARATNYVEQRKDQVYRNSSHVGK